MLKRHLVAAAVALILFPVAAMASESSTMIWLSSSAKVAQGAHLIDRGDMMQGMRVTLEALEEELTMPDRAAALNNLCTAEVALKRLHDAIEHCTKAVRIRGSLWQGYNNRANAYFMLGNYDAAISDYNRALTIRPEMGVLEYNLTLAIERKARKAPPIIEEWES